MPRHSDWAARQAAYMTAVKEFIVKLNPEFTSIEVTFVKALNVGRKEDKRLFLSVDCKDVQQCVTFCAEPSMPLTFFYSILCRFGKNSPINLILTIFVSSKRPFININVIIPDLPA